LEQRTIGKTAEISGIGLHTGNKVNLKMHPAAEDTGIVFVRSDLDGKPEIKVDLKNVQEKSEIPRCTSLGNKEIAIYTVEHLLSVLYGFGISNLRVEVDANEMPGLDGSGIGFWQAIEKAGIVHQDRKAEAFEIKEPLGAQENGASLYVVPSDDFRISYVLDYDYPLLKSQFVDMVVDDETFLHEIAPCRTFCVEDEAEELRAKGLGKGANYHNTLIVGKEGIVKNKSYFKDEFARHKILDLIGDLSLLGIRLKGHIFAVKSGHALNLCLAKAIERQREKYAQKGKIELYDIQGKTEIDISGIMKILPHRYPFLLVDRVIELEKGVKGVGIKNVTINDGFFQGHFPTRPVMPGVLMIEAMAQTAGVVILTNKSHEGKLALFMAINDVKFRRMVVPGDQLVMEVNVVKCRSRVAQVKGTCRVAQDIAAEATMTFSFADDSYLDF
jgi:UDP-3-O-[3-hydroxymyristoyl] N-acetylglucosamine deacetylase/3-hydroxyacyl-[acyl-carrier-protein] dehydratase